MEKLVLFLVCCWCFWSGNAQNARNITIEGSERRIALVMGNDNYNIERFKLDNCIKDAQMMVEALKKCKFEVIYCPNGSRMTMLQKMDDFFSRLPNYDVALVYYSGHGGVLDGVQYMMPIDVSSPYSEEGGGRTLFRNTAVDIESTVLAEFNKRQDKINFLILDACRSNFNDDSRIAKSKSPNEVEENKSKFDQHTGTTIVYSTGVRHRSFEGVYTEELVKLLPVSNKDYSLMLKDVAAAVRKKQEAARISGLQQPQTAEGNDKYFCFNPNAKPINDSKKQSDVVHDTVIKTVVIGGTTNTTAPPVTDNNNDNIPAGFVYVQGGTFDMGKSADGNNAGTVHSVTVSDFYMCDHEVTQAEWVAVMGNNLSSFKGDNLPVEDVSWEDAQDYIAKLNANRNDGYKYRLPTEAEWEYAAKGGIHHENTTYSGSNILTSVGWYWDNSETEGSKQTHPVKQLAANALGLYDMSGNVWEWCSDWYGAYPSNAETNPTGAPSGSFRVNRGGSLNFNAADCRSAYRHYNTPTLRGVAFGFRLALAARR
ncbi:MAG: hypothetical protein EBX41_00220 [Chitinophagia bacterium]|nr:hypothetical protein [Chitinophagia bacterium]